MKEKNEILFENIRKSRNFYHEYNICRVKTEADALIKQMKVKLDRTYSETLLKLDEMNRIFESNDEKINKK